jgi:hypothetical protein
LTAERDQHLIDRASAGDLSGVEKLLAAGASFRAQDEEALYQALKGGHGDVAKALLVARLQEKAGREDAEFSDTMQANFLKASMKDMDTLQQLSFAIQHGSAGLMRFLREEHPDSVIESGLAYVAQWKQTRFISDILDTGVEIEKVTGFLFYTLIVEGNIAATKDMIARGINPSLLYEYNDYHGSYARHPLQAAAELKDPALREEFYDLLVGAGSDLRVKECSAIRIMLSEGLTDIFDLYERMDPGSEMMAVFGHGQSMLDATNIEEEALKRFPYLQKWIDRNLILPLWDGDEAVYEDWCARVTPADLAADDGFLLKLAAVSPRAEAALLHLIGMGASPNTEKDTPLKIAALTGNHELALKLMLNGADPYGGHAATLRGMDKIYKKEVEAVLQGATEAYAFAAQTILDTEFSGSSDLAALRGTSASTGETGLVLAAKAGVFEPQDGLMVADFLQENARHTTLAAILATRGEYEAMFSPKIWHGTMPGIEKLWAALTPAEQQQAAKRYDHLLENRSVAGKQELLKELAKAKKPKLTL